MDPRRFDQLSRTVAGRLSRRQAMRRLGGGGLAASVLAALGIEHALGSSQQDPTPAAEDVTCVLTFRATARVGPSAERERTSELTGDLTITLDPDGVIEGELNEPDGNTLSVSGQATGRAIHLRIAVGDGETLVAVGAAEQPVRDCQGAMDGPSSGPQAGDLGEWRAVVDQDLTATVTPSVTVTATATAARVSPARIAPAPAPVARCSTPLPAPVAVRPAPCSVAPRAST